MPCSCHSDFITISATRSAQVYSWCLESQASGYASSFVFGDLLVVFLVLDSVVLLFKDARCFLQTKRSPPGGCPICFSMRITDVDPLAQRCSLQQWSFYRLMQQYDRLMHSCRGLSDSKRKSMDRVHLISTLPSALPG